MVQSNFNKEAGDGFSKNYLHRNYIGMVGYRYKYNRDIHFEPSVLIRKTESTKSQYDFSTRVKLKNISESIDVGINSKTIDCALPVISFDSNTNRSV